MKNRQSFMKSPVICAASLGMTARYYYLQLQYEMKSKDEKAALDQWWRKQMMTTNVDKTKLRRYNAVSFVSLFRY